MPEISVIVPIYRVEAYLDRCVESLVRQSFSDLEILLVDDGSPDRCGELCDLWAARDRRIRVLHRKNGGLSEARNTGLAAAGGTYIAFADGDDVLHPDFLGALYRAARRAHAQLAVCAVAPFSGDECPLPDRCPAPETILTAKQALGAMLDGKMFHCVVWNKLYHRSLLRGVTFPPGKFHEDEFFTYRVVAAAQTVAFVDTPLYFYRKRADSLMCSASLHGADALQARLERLAFLRTYDAALYRADKFRFCVSCAWLYRTAPHAQARSDVRTARKKVRFSARELSEASWRERLYALGTGLCIGPFCRLLRLRHRLRGTAEPN